jgi:hypothetical protein
MSPPGEEALALLFAAMAEDPQVLYFPVRHHSPACAFHLARRIRETRPASIVIEGPDDLTPLIPWLLHPDTRAPVAVYTTYAGPAGRFAAYYPLCDSSPELVALRVGSEVGAELRFADLTWPEQVLAGRAGAEELRVSLMEEAPLRRSDYLQRLARRAGCRDTDELWDHCFEVGRQESAEDFIREVAAWCALARLADPPEALAADGTLVRERAMAFAVQDQRERDRAAGRSGPVLVVTGGYHTAALPFLLRSPCERPRIEIPPGEAQTALMRYSFDRLDALNGYASGLPSPRYYDLLWRLLEEGRPAPHAEAAARLVVEIGRLTRERDLPFAVSPADEIAALEQARRLADLRGHPGPSREDLLDGLRSAFVKGALDAEGSTLLAVLRHTLAGTAVGDVPAGAGVPPLVEDFRRRAEALGLPVRDTAPRKLALEIYRKEPHRRTSRLLHSLGFLGAPFAAMTAGPDFARGQGLDRMLEHWQWAWSPAGETALLEASVWGATVEEAAAGRLRRAVTELEAAGLGRSALPAVRLLVAACRMGLQSRAGEVLGLLEASVAEDPSFASLGTALAELALLWRSREPLEAHRLTAVPSLAQAAYRRACFLAGELAACPESEVEAALQALGSLREAVAGAAAGGEGLFDPDLFLESLEAVAAATEGRTVLVGAAAGILFGEGRLKEEPLLTLVRGHLGGTAEAAARTGFLRGLLATAREAAWSLPPLLGAVDALLAGWSEEDFHRSLPELRLAFSQLTPRETRRVAEGVAALHGGRSLGELVHQEIHESDLRMALLLDREVGEALRHDRLEGRGEP